MLIKFGYTGGPRRRYGREGRLWNRIDIYYRHQNIYRMYGRKGLTEEQEDAPPHRPETQK